MALTDTLRILITANGAQAMREFQKVGAAANTNLGKAETGTKRFGLGLVSAGAGVAAFAATAYYGLNRVAQAADEEALAIDKLNNSIDNSPALVGASTDAFLEQAAALQDTTKFADEATIGAQAMLATFRLTESQILALTPLVQDVSAKFGVDLNRAAVQVGKAMQGSIGGLQRWGVIIDEDAYAADRFGAVLDALRENAGGFAEQEGQTLNGQMEIMKNNLGDLVEAIGAQAIPVMTDMAGTVTDVAEAFGDASKAIGGFDLGPLDSMFGALLGDFDLTDLTPLGPIKEWWEAVSDFRGGGSIVADALAEIEDASFASTAAQEANRGAAMAVADGFTGQADAAAQAADALDALTERQDAYLERTLGLGDARDELASSFNSLYESLLTGSRAFRGNSNAAIENRAALDEIVTGTAGVIQQQQQHNASQRRLTATKRQAIAQIRATATAFGLERSAVDRAVAAIRGIPTRADTSVHLAATADVSQALGSLANLEGRIRAVAIAYGQADANRAAALAALTPAGPVPESAPVGGRSGGNNPTLERARMSRQRRGELQLVKVVD